MNGTKTTERNGDLIGDAATAVNRYRPAPTTRTAAVIVFIVAVAMTFAAGGSLTMPTPATRMPFAAPTTASTRCVL